MILEMAFSLLITTSSSRGTSNTASWVADRASEGREHLQNAYSLGLRAKGVFDDLWTLVQDYREPNWDGYDAAPVTDDTYRMAYRFLEALPPGTAAPAMGAEPDGHITLEWYQSPRKTVSISVSPEGELHYAALLPGPRKVNGTEPFV